MKHIKITKKFRASRGEIAHTRGDLFYVGRATQSKLTCRADLHHPVDVWRMIQHLTQDIGHRLRLHGLKAKDVQLTIKDTHLAYRQYQMQVPIGTQSPLEIAQVARTLFTKHYDWQSPVRAIYLEPLTTPDQMILFDDVLRRQKRDKLNDVVKTLRGRFGKWSIYPASLMGTLNLADDGNQEVIMPGTMYT